MNESQSKELEKETARYLGKQRIKVSELSDLKDRTLVLGTHEAPLDKTCIFHVYLKDGLLNAYVYDEDRTVTHSRNGAPWNPYLHIYRHLQGKDLPVHSLKPSVLCQMNTVDFEFAQLMLAKHQPLMNICDISYLSKGVNSEGFHALVAKELFRP